MASDLRDLIRNPTPVELELVARYGALPANGARERAFEAFANVGLPHRRVEGWKWSDFKSAVQTLEKSASGPATDPFAEIDAPRLHFSGLKLTGDDALPGGLRAFRKEDGQAFGGAETLPLGALTAALAAKPAALMVEVTGRMETPMHLVFDGKGAMAFHRIVFVVRPGARLDLVESYLGGAAFNGALVEIAAAEGAEVDRVIYQAAGADQLVSIASQVTLDKGARLGQTTLAYGAKRTRIETDLTHRTGTSLARMDAAYLAGGGYHIDLTSRVRHGAPDCETHQLTKGAARKGGKAVFQGKFHVARIAQKTDADMQHHALLLEDGAEVDAKPELEIYADDVACAHGNTSGALDGHALFYLRQRGVPEAQARAILTEAHIAEVFDSEPEGPVRDALLASVRGCLHSA